MKLVLAATALLLSSGVNAADVYVPGMPPGAYDTFYVGRDGAYLPVSND
jgi:hypothetical protein